MPLTCLAVAIPLGEKHKSAHKSAHGHSWIKIKAKKFTYVHQTYKIEMRKVLRKTETKSLERQSVSL